MTNSSTFLLGAYAMGPFRAADWTPERQASFDEQLLTLPDVGGFEIPIARNGRIHEFDPDGFGKFLERWAADRASVGHVLTAVFGTMQFLSENPSIGLASNDRSGREAALTFARQVYDVTTSLKARFGDNVVRAVQFQSAPRGGTADALRDSLQEICSWDWGKTVVTIEHCDAVTEGWSPQKGFLGIESEIQVISDLRACSTTTPQLGMVINWGRSAVEGRSVETPIRHISLAKAAGILEGIVFSGAAAAETSPGANDAWHDLHCPPVSPEEGIDYPGGLLSVAEMRRARAAAGPDFEGYVGLKVMTRTASTRYDDMSAEDRIRIVNQSLELLKRALGD